MKTLLISSCGLFFLLVAVVLISCQSCKTSKQAEGRADETNSSKSAKVTYYSISQSTSYVDENGNLPPAHHSDTTTVVVKKGSKINNFEVQKVTADSITIKSTFGTYHYANKSGEVFTLKRGESAKLEEMYVMDASFYFCIKVE